MKKYYIFIFLVFKTILYSQNSVQLKLVKTERIKVDNLLGVDRFDSYYYLNNNAFEKKQIDKIFSYSNLQLGKIDQVKIFKGFFNDSLKTSELLSRQFSFAFIDCDIYESANDAFKYLQTRLSRGAFIMIDDFSSIDKNGNSIYKSFVEHFEIGNEVILYSTYSNGKVYRYMKET